MNSRQKTQILFVYLHVCNLHVGNSISIFGIILLNFVDLKKYLIKRYTPNIYPQEELLSAPTTLNDSFEDFLLLKN